MGRLKTIRILIKKHPKSRVIINWFVPALLALVVILGVQVGVKADPAPTKSELATYLQAHELNVGTEGVNGYDQVFYTYNGKRVVLTTENYNHIDVFSSKEYVVWEGEIDYTRQIFVYNILTDAKIQLTGAGTNQGPYVHSGIVVWEKWDGSTWQVMYFNGSQTRQLTNGSTPSVGASTNGKQIIYAEQLSTDLWKAQSYDLSTGQTTTMREGDTVSTAYPHFRSDGSVDTTYTAQ